MMSSRLEITHSRAESLAGDAMASSAGDRKVPVTLDRKDSDSEAEHRPDKRGWTVRQLQHACDHHDRRACQSRQSI